MTTFNIYLDFKFNPTFPNFFPLSLGMATEDGDQIYFEYEHNPGILDPWVIKNVVPHLTESAPKFRREIAGGVIRAWLEYQLQQSGKEKIEFWGHEPSHDWVLMCQHWTFDTSPKILPRNINCLRQLAHFEGITDFPDTKGLTAHFAMNDAIWARHYHTLIKSGRCKNELTGTYPVPDEPLTLNIHNDHKEKMQSFEASTPDLYVDVIGYGYNKEEAIEEFVQKLRVTMGKLIHLENTLKNVSIETVEVDYIGKPIA